MNVTAKVGVISASSFSTGELRGIKARTLLLIGDKEQLYEPVATLELARKRMPALEGGIVANADHVAAVAQPEEVNRRILDFLQR